MKPKNRMYCHLAGKAKMTFEEEKEALRFIKFNTADPSEWEGGKMPVRAYYCVSCAAWHVTSSKTPQIDQDRDIKEQERILDRVIQETKKLGDIENNLRRKAKELSLSLCDLEKGLKVARGSIDRVPEIRDEFLSFLERWKELQLRMVGHQEVLDSKKVINLEKRVKIFTETLYNEFLRIEIGNIRKKLLETEVLLNYGLPDLAEENYIEAAKIYYELASRESPDNLRGLEHDFEVMKKKVDISKAAGSRKEEE